MHHIETLPKPTRSIETDTLIIGGGISALSAKRWLEKQGQRNILLVEMDDHFGGNSHFGKNSVSAYPWGAHYIPLPDIRNIELIDFLYESKVITGFDSLGIPVYNEYYLCQDPEERLFINGLWQEGVIPEAGIHQKDKEEFKKFAALINYYKSAKGTDGKDAFTIPVDKSTTDDIFRKLDKISFKTFLDNEAFTSKYLLWYLEYCCKDDYGSNLESTSAWAGIHYFAARKGKGTNGNSGTILTWPQGNGFLMEQLKLQSSQSGLMCNQLVYNISNTNSGIDVSVYDTQKQESYVIHTKKAILTAPQYVNKHLLKNLIPEDKLNIYKDFEYAPWVIANLTVNKLPQLRGLPLCWDNVIYGTQSVGYVNANHQDLANSLKKVITFYLPLVGKSTDATRKNAQAKNYEDWLKIIVSELEYAHPGISTFIEHVDIWIWGHGMIAPRPDFIWGQSRRMAGEPINNKLFFAHSDLSGISIFEEAFYQGIKAAKQVLAI